jgi:hypothetical protein
VYGETCHKTVYFHLFDRVPPENVISDL